ncbi:N-acetyl-gamma-glutamyl-phosphate reductase [Parasphingopyxis lamellibrachiae]|uniref:N-acetyl-gamma-glutamyl-phosphate reductase n=1 Tax=Parasphingopyxis lamellibrachiae TaxID=680125 RepID=A0A3D9FDH8_9SPHN|nr:N-acetyl-gamma-glutamyl-phosphate reductase [Parasphingopyxis lamellibrachiae]RED15880.1 N-acetyl-gamma-glutamyl-phosphate reductase [Parasphingopyxis lamellibrachiae]
MTISVFIDGGHGTTGLEIRERLAERAEIALIALDDDRRKDANARLDALNGADIAILCLPDDAARDAVAMVGNGDTKIIDASTAHRTTAGWTYGFPEWETGHRNAIASSRRVGNPGCYAQTFIALTHPLILAGILPGNTCVSVNAVSGYSGGGRAMIEEFGGGASPTAFRNYALPLRHKHLPEMQQHSGLDNPPLFSPSVANLYQGMLVEIPLHLSQMRAGTTDSDIRTALQERYADSRLIAVLDEEDSAALDAVTIERCAGTDRMDIMVFANSDSGQIRLCAVLDNLGKGAAGAAVQNLNLMGGFDEYAGLRF